MTPARLTDRQSEIVAFIRGYVDVNGYPPTSTEIGQWLGITHQGVADHLDRMEARGVLSRIPGGGRRIKLEK